MDDLISRQSAIDALGERPMVWTEDNEYDLGCVSQYDLDRLAIEAVPSADVQPVRHGRWEWIASTAVEQHGTWLPYLKEGLTVKCSECGSRFDRPWHYCPSCGATMDGDRNDIR